MAATKRLIVNADDFGQSPGINEGIIESFERGIVTSTSLMVRWPAVSEAARYAKGHTELSVGLHLDLGEWAYRRREWVPLYEVVQKDDDAAVGQEISRQLAFFRELLGREPTHIDSHQHVHRAEPVHSLLMDAARNLGVPLRLNSHVRYLGDFYGQTGDGEPLWDCITVETLKKVLLELMPGITELGCHPAKGIDLETMYSAERLQELDVLCDHRIRDCLVENGIELCSFRKVGETRSSTAGREEKSAVIRSQETKHCTFAPAALANNAGRDCAFLALFTMLSAVFYISRVGFYWDDWVILEIFHFSDDQSFIGLTRSMFLEWPETLSRPAQVFQWAALYRLFGLQPLGYHLVSPVIFFSGLCLFYLVLQAITGQRLISLATTVVYGSLPHYSTDRVWQAILAANFSMVFYFLSLYADLRQLTFERSRIWSWRVVSALGLLISMLSYELFMPFFLLNPFLIALKRRQLKSAGREVAESRGQALFYLVNPALLALLAFFKSRTTARAPAPSGFGWWLVDNSLTASVDLTFGAYGVHLPRILAAISTKYWNWYSCLIALSLAVVTAWYLMHVAGTSKERLPRALYLAFFVFAGTLASGVSYAYLYSFYGVNTGVNNRVTIAAAVGVAIAWTSLAGLLSRPLGGRDKSNRAFCVVAALVCGCCCLINNSISEFWIQASDRQHEILRDMKQNFPAVPSGSTIMLTGLCAWIGPGIVFEADYDTTGALSLLYDDATIRGYLMWPWVKVTAEGIEPLTDPMVVLSSADAGRNRSYASLYVYDVRSREAHRISDETVAAYYVKRAAEDNVDGCLTLGYGTGLPIW